ncbi:MAG: adenine-specific DNA-methyltransferase [Verrucomicrobiota bacterium]|jgi:adenine-specific DNA-methyltransferase
MPHLSKIADASIVTALVIYGRKAKSAGFAKRMKILTNYAPRATAVAYHGDCMRLLASIPDESVSLVVTSPPYNIGKEYEKRQAVQAYVDWQRIVIQECYQKLANDGSICWQVGNYVENGSILPIDILLHTVFAELGMKLRNRIVWHFEHGLHCSQRLSGRYEVIMWYTKTDDYFFNVDPIRVAQKYPGKKSFKGPNAGKPSCNPLGKNPGDVWIFPNVKSNHIEKTGHPCQFPIELVERLILSLTERGELVVDPFMGVGSTQAAAILNGRRTAGAETDASYYAIAKDRMRHAAAGTLKVRTRNTPVFDPAKAGKSLTTAPWLFPKPLRHAGNRAA